MRLNSLLMIALLLSCAVTAAAQDTAKTSLVEYKPGQVWKYKTARGAEESRVVVLDVESRGKKDNL